MKKSGIIHPDSPSGREIGFTSDKFEADAYLWRSPGRIMVSFMATKHEGKGHFRDLVQAIRRRGLDVAIPTPLGRMAHIVRKCGYVRTTEPHSVPAMGDVEIWTLKGLSR